MSDVVSIHNRGRISVPGPNEPLDISQVVTPEAMAEARREQALIKERYDRSNAILQDAGLVPANTPAEAIENLGQRVIRLQAEMQGLAREHIRQFEAALYEASRLAVEIAKGGDAYHVGVRELAERLAPDFEAQAKTIEALTSRKGG